MTRKAYADSKHTDYDYPPDGRVEMRTWARLNGGSALTTSYSYATGGSATGAFTGVSYSDGTPSITATYNRSGRSATVADAVGARTFTYETDGSTTTETFDSSSRYGAKILTTNYKDSITLPTPVRGPVPPPAFMPRLSQIRVGVSGSLGPDYNTTYDYEQETGRMDRVTGPGLPSYGAAYEDATDSPLVTKVSFKNAQTGTAWGTMTRTYDPDRPLLESVENKWGTTSGGTTVSKYVYRYDELGRRTDVVRTGSAFAATNGSGTAGSGTSDNLDLWGYNPRHELTGSERYASTQPSSPSNPVHALDRAYTYDPIGNRTESIEGTAAAVEYCANNLNQFQALDADAGCPTPSETFSYDDDGNLTESNATGTIAPGTGGGGGPRQQDYVWDAENRLAAVLPAGTPVSGDQKVEFTYDFRGRRVEKRVYAYASGSWGSPQTTTRYIYFGWHLLAEYTVSASTLTLQRTNTWGLDLSQTVGGAGGIGGLLATLDTQGTTSVGDDKKYVYFYDGNGNVGQVIDTSTTSSTTIAARYKSYATGNIGTGLSFPFGGGYAPSPQRVFVEGVGYVVVVGGACYATNQAMVGGP